MPVSGAGTERLGDEVVALITAAEAVIMAKIAVALTGLDRATSAGSSARLALELARLRYELVTVLDDAYKDMYPALVEAFRAAMTLGLTRADEDAALHAVTTGATVADLGAPVVNDRAVATLARELADRIRDNTRIPALRAVDDVFRVAQAQALIPALAGSQTRAQAAGAMALDLAEQGLDGFTDAAGRTWRLDTYTEMAVRSAMQRTTIQSHLDRFAERGWHLVQVTYVVHCCDLCAPWQGAILSDGKDTDREKALGHTTVSEAMAAGLLHPGCRHTLTFYEEGVTERGKPIMSSAANAQGYRLTQGQRYRERVLREKKRRELAAAEANTVHPHVDTAQALEDAKKATKEARARLAAYTDQHGLTRRRERETPVGAR